MRALLLALLLVASVSCGPRDAAGAAAPRFAGASAAADLEGCDAIGSWRHEHPTYASEIVICTDADGVTRVRQAFADGSVYQGELTPLEGGDGERFLRDPEFSDYYEVLPDGRLVIGDEHGEIATVERVD